MCLYLWVASSRSGTSTWQTEGLSPAGLPYTRVYEFPLMDSILLSQRGKQDGAISAVFVWMIWVSACDLCGQPHLCVYMWCICMQCTHALKPCLDMGTWSCSRLSLPGLMDPTLYIFSKRYLHCLYIHTFQTKKFDLVQYVICVTCRWKNFYFGERKNVSQTHFCLFCLRKSLAVLIPRLIFITLSNP